MSDVQWWQECEIEKDRAWEGQYRCSTHDVWFRDSIHPLCCPAVRLAEQVHEEQSSPAMPSGTMFEYLEDEQCWLAYDSGHVVLRYREDTGRITFALKGVRLEVVRAFVAEIERSK